MPTSNADTAGVEAATRAWIEAFNAGEPSGICALYHPDAVLWGTTAPSIITTPGGLRRYFEGHCAAESPPTVTLTGQYPRVYGDTAINSGSYTLSVHLQGQLRALPARYSFTYCRVGGQWRIVDHHSSFVPEPAR